MSTETVPNYLDMSDDEIMSMSAPVVAVAPAVVVDHDETAKPAEGGGATEPAGTEAGTAGSDTGHPEAAAGGEGSGEGGATAGTDEVAAGEGAASTEGANTTKPAAAADTKPADKPAVDEPVARDGKAAPAASTTFVNKPVADYSLEEKAAAFDALMAPFKANGREIKLETPQEIQQLKQMGANFTKKMQALQPQLRIIKMLENNSLLDENKLAHLIDISKGDPLAIQKMLDDSQFDPMAIDKDKAADYTPGNHQVTATEMQFEQALDDVIETSHGLELVKEVRAQWDEESKQVLFQSPQLLRDLHQQKEIGLYQLINNEVARLTALGQIPPGTPFLTAYRGVGEMLKDQGKLKAFGAPAAGQELKPVEERVVAPAPVVDNNDRAKAAASTKATGAAAEPEEVNFLAESDEDFLKRMRNRV